jgi:hypothetical protein
LCGNTGREEEEDEEEEEEQRMEEREVLTRKQNAPDTRRSVASAATRLSDGGGVDWRITNLLVEPNVSTEPD